MYYPHINENKVITINITICQNKKIITNVIIITTKVLQNTTHFLPVYGWLADEDEEGDEGDDGVVVMVVVNVVVMIIMMMMAEVIKKDGCCNGFSRFFFVMCISKYI